MQSGMRSVRQQGFGSFRGMNMRNVSDRPKTNYLANAVWLLEKSKHCATSSTWDWSDFSN